MPDQPLFIDLFAGCGGLSLGLANSGWKGLFAIEKNPMAFETLKHNLIDKGSYIWPQWLEEKPYDIKDFLDDYHKELSELQGKVDLVVGGPPCQGFSFRGKRDGDDKRNYLFTDYIKLVKLIRPHIIMLENVQGITVSLKNSKNKQTPVFSNVIEKCLSKIGYKTFSQMVYFDKYGIPQTRKRYILIGFDTEFWGKTMDNPFPSLEEIRLPFLTSKGLTNQPVTIKDAISDLEYMKFGKTASPDSKGFCHGLKGPSESNYQIALNENCDYHGPLDSHRLVNHKPSTVNKFEFILNNCRKGVQVSGKERALYKLGEHSFVAADPDIPAPTLTSLPDDLLHYSEPRVLTVREYARIQSFPDWFEFKGKYTTGNKYRVIECPRYTQIANAVPPFFSELLGNVLLKYVEDINETDEEIVMNVLP